MDQLVVVLIDKLKGIDLLHKQRGISIDQLVDSVNVQQAGGINGQLVCSINGQLEVEINGQLVGDINGSTKI